MDCGRRESKEDDEEFPLMGKSKLVHLILLKVYSGGTE